MLLIEVQFIRLISERGLTLQLGHVISRKLHVKRHAVDEKPKVEPG